MAAKCPPPIIIIAMLRFGALAGGDGICWYRSNARGSSCRSSSSNMARYIPKDVGCGRTEDVNHINGDRDLLTLLGVRVVELIVCLARSFDNGSWLVDEAVDSVDSEPDIDSFRSAISKVKQIKYHQAFCQTHQPLLQVDPRLFVSD